MVFHVSGKLWEAQAIGATCLEGSVRLNLWYFMCLGEVWGFQPLTKLRPRVRPPKKDLTSAGGAEESWRL